MVLEGSTTGAQAKAPEPTVEAKGEPVAVDQLLADKTHADTVFLLGNDKSTRVEVHRALLSKVSKVFESMLSSAPKTLFEVTLPDVHEEIFLAMMDCVYTGHTSRITPENFAACFEAANRFQVVAFQTCVVSYLESGEHFTPKTLLDMLGRFASLGSREAEVVWQYIELQAQLIVALPNFTQLSHEVIFGLLQRQYLSCSEFELFKAVLAWGKAKAGGAAPKGVEVRTALGDLLPLIRFPTMTSAQLLDVAVSGVLTEEELTAVRNFVVKSTSKKAAAVASPDEVPTAAAAASSAAAAAGGAAAAAAAGGADGPESDGKTPGVPFNTKSRGSGTLHHAHAVENRFRALFAKGAQVGKEADGLLINVYENKSSFAFPHHVEFTNVAIPLILDSSRLNRATHVDQPGGRRYRFNRNQPPPPVQEVKGSSIASVAGFHCMLYHITLGMLEGLDWNNVCLAGGAVTASVFRDDTVEKAASGALGPAGAGDDDGENDDGGDDEEDFPDEEFEDDEEASGKKGGASAAEGKGEAAAAAADPANASDTYAQAAVGGFASKPRNGADPNLHSRLLDYVQCATIEGGNFSFEDSGDHTPFRGSDVDLFLYNLSPDKAAEKVRAVYKTIRGNMSKREPLMIVRTAHAITFVPPWPRPQVQIILRCYQSISEILLGFDLDAACFAYDGKNGKSSRSCLLVFSRFPLPLLIRLVCILSLLSPYLHPAVLTTARGRHAMRMRMNVIDQTRQSTTYESRLLKYSARGFAVGVPGFRLDRVDLAIYSKRVSELHGLAKLLRLGALIAEQSGRGSNSTTAEAQQLSALKDSDYSSANPWLMSRPFFNNVQSIINAHKGFCTQGAVVPFYFVMGKGPNSVNAALDASLLNGFSRDIAGLVNKEGGGGRRRYNEPTPDEAAKGVERQKALFQTLAVVEDKFVFENGVVGLPVRAKFITTDPGRQYTGSFHPLHGDWFADAYGRAAN